MINSPVVSLNVHVKSPHVPLWMTSSAEADTVKPIANVSVAKSVDKNKSAFFMMFSSFLNKNVLIRKIFNNYWTFIIT